MLECKSFLNTPYFLISKKRFKYLYHNNLQRLWCIRYFKDTNSKANHNEFCPLTLELFGVFDISKIQIQKQITTCGCVWFAVFWVYSIFQRYKFKSKSQQLHPPCKELTGVFDISKIQIQKQITTDFTLYLDNGLVYSIFQRYKFKSKSQPLYFTLHLRCRCIRYFKDTNSKANHNLVISY